MDKLFRRADKMSCSVSWGVPLGPLVGNTVDVSIGRDFWLNAERSFRTILNGASQILQPPLTIAACSSCACCCFSSSCFCSNFPLSFFFFLIIVRVLVAPSHFFFFFFYCNEASMLFCCLFICPNPSLFVFFFAIVGNAAARGHLLLCELCLWRSNV